MNTRLHGTTFHESPVRFARPEKFHWDSRFLSNEFRVLSTLSATGLVLGVANVGGGAFSGLCLGFGAILFGLSFIMKAVQMAENAGHSA